MRKPRPPRFAFAPPAASVARSAGATYVRVVRTRACEKASTKSVCGLFFPSVDSASEAGVAQWQSS